MDNILLMTFRTDGVSGIWMEEGIWNGMDSRWNGMDGMEWRRVRRWGDDILNGESGWIGSPVWRE